MTRWVLSWTCFRIGAACGWICHRCDPLVPIFYRPYQKFIAWSSDIQGATDQGPWQRPAHQTGPEGQ